MDSQNVYASSLMLTLILYNFDLYIVFENYKTVSNWQNRFISSGVQGRKEGGKHYKYTWIEISKKNLYNKVSNDNHDIVSTAGMTEK